jgi:hypothetical protein
MIYRIRCDLQEQVLAAGDTLQVYVPFGTDWSPYFMRRLSERPANCWFVLRSLLAESGRTSNQPRRKPAGFSSRVSRIPWPENAKSSRYQVVFFRDMQIIKKILDADFAMMLDSNDLVRCAHVRVEAKTGTRLKSLYLSCFVPLRWTRPVASQLEAPCLYLASVLAFGFFWPVSPCLGSRRV